MDSIDKKILWTLRCNCRVQYQEIANDLNLSLNAVKSRIRKLVDTGVIVQFGVWLAYSVINAGYAFILVNFDGSQDEDYIMKSIAEKPMTMGVGFNSIGSGLVRVEYQGLGNLADYGTFLRKLPGVDSVEIHPVAIIPPKSYEFSKPELKVLRCLREEPRIPVRTIASRTGMTSKRISEMIQRFLKDNLIQFSIDWNLNAGGSTQFYFQIEYDENVSSHKELDQYIRENFGEEYWGMLRSSIQPLVLVFFVVDHIREAEAIAKEIRKRKSVQEIQTIIPYPEMKLQGLCGTLLDEMLENIEC
ncbi:MAG: winged helix-turn-helix transcriptional regulator [Candidatus Thorarchaeota archaeon]|jgi:DNA-binding Lrp family transcriptional regulator